MNTNANKTSKIKHAKKLIEKCNETLKATHQQLLFYQERVVSKIGFTNKIKD